MLAVYQAEALWPEALIEFISDSCESFAKSPIESNWGLCSLPIGRK